MSRVAWLILVGIGGACVGLAGGWLGSSYRYTLSGDGQTMPQEVRKIVSVPIESAHCLYRSDKYRHGEMIQLTGANIVQICVVGERARWVTVPPLQ